MAHRALTLKYRPQVFADLVGQDHVTHVLSAALDSGRVAHAFLFTGARGVGKTTSARILAKALNCENRGKASPATKGKGKSAAGESAAGGRALLSEPCGTCNSCVEIASGVSLDVLEIDGASNRGIADVQALRESVRFAPTGGRYRVVIIDEVHQLSGDAFAALLKTLEEPPAHLVFILATTDPQKLPDTIRSRTQRFDFARVAIRRVADRLIEIERREGADADGVKFKLTDGAALLIAHKGEGSMRDAVSALDQVVSAGDPAIDEALVRRVLGIPDREVFFRIGDGIVRRDPQATLRELHAAFDHGQDPKELAEGLAEHFRNVLVVKVDPEKSHELVAASNEDLARLKSQGEAWADTDLLRLMRLAAECQWPMRDSPQPLVHLEAAVLQMATLEPAESVAILIERLEALERRLGGGAVSAIGGAPPTRGAAPAGPRSHGFSPASTPSVMPPAANPFSALPAASEPPARGFTPTSNIALPAPPLERQEPASPRAVLPPPGPPAAVSRPRAADVVPRTPAGVPTDVVLDDACESAWKSAMVSMNTRKRMLGAFLEEVTLVGVSGDTVLLAMDGLHRAVVDSAEHRPVMLDELSRAFGRTMDLKCVEGEAKSIARRNTAAATDLQPIIDRAMKVFDGELIDRAPRGGERNT